MNVNTETRETARVSNALDALKAARSAMRLADKKRQTHSPSLNDTARETGAINAATTHGTRHTRLISAHSQN